MAISTEQDRVAFWRTMTALQKHYGSFTSRIVVDLVGVERRMAVGNYFNTLIEEKVIEFESGAPVGGQETRRYRIINLGEAPPIRMRDKGARHRALWTAMRSLKSFREVELAAAAATEELPIGREAASIYAGELVAAGYLAIVAVAPTKFATATYRLNPGRNTGPRAPIVLQAEGICFDLNLMKSVNLNKPRAARRAA